MRACAAVAGSPCTARVAAASINAMPCHQKFCTDAASSAASSNKCQSPFGRRLLQHKAERVPGHRPRRRVVGHVGHRDRLLRGGDTVLGGAQRGVADRDVEHVHTSRIGSSSSAGAQHLGVVVRKRRVRVALIKRQVGEYVAGIGDAAVATAGTRPSARFASERACSNSPLFHAPLAANPTTAA